MRTCPAVPFHFFSADESVRIGPFHGMTVRERTISGLLSLGADAVTVQFQVARGLVHMGGGGLVTERTTEPVQECVVPLTALADLRVQRPRWRTRADFTLVLVAKDLRAFEQIPGANGHELALRVAGRNRDDAEEFASELQLALADEAVRLSDADRPLALPRTTLYLGVVYGVDGVTFASASPTRAGLAAELSAYAHRQADDRLWADDARDVHDLYELGQHHAAVERYFSAVGGRWDAERLELREVDA